MVQPMFVSVSLTEGLLGCGWLCGLMCLCLWHRGGDRIGLREELVVIIYRLANF